MARVVDEKAVVNGIVGLLATGGSTNHTLHLVAMARRGRDRASPGTISATLSAVTPLLARVYPNGAADVNHFHAAGGMAFVVRQLLDAGLAHDDVLTVAGPRPAPLSAGAVPDGDGPWSGATAPAAVAGHGILRPVTIRSTPRAASAC